MQFESNTQTTEFCKVLGRSLHKSLTALELQKEGSDFCGCWSAIFPPKRTAGNLAVLQISWIWYTNLITKWRKFARGAREAGVIWWLLGLQSSKKWFNSPSHELPLTKLKTTLCERKKTREDSLLFGFWISRISTNSEEIKRSRRVQISFLSPHAGPCRTQSW